MKKIPLIVFLLVGLSCNTSVIIEPEESLLPQLSSVSDVNKQQLSQINSFISQENGRIQENLDYEAAISAKYEGFENLELVYIPSSLNDYEFDVYTFKDGELLNHVLKIENYKELMILTNSSGEVRLTIEDNKVVEGNVVYNQTTNGRVDCSASDLAGGFLDCTDAVIDQSREALGNVGGLIFDIGCSLWVVCRGAVVVACGGIAVVEC